MTVQAFEELILKNVVKDAVEEWMMSHDVKSSSGDAIQAAGIALRGTDLTEVYLSCMSIDQNRRQAS